MSLKRENLTTRSSQVAFSGTFAANGVQVGNLINLEQVLKTQMALADGNTVNGTQSYTFKAKSVDFYIYVLGYTSGTFTPIVEGIGIQDFAVTNPQIGYVQGTAITPAAAAALLPANPSTNTTYAVSTSKLITYNYGNTPAPQSGSYITYFGNGPVGTHSGADVLPTISAAMSRADAAITVNPALNFSFSVLPAFGESGDILSFLRVSFAGTGTSVGQILVNAEITYEGLF